MSFEYHQEATTPNVIAGIFYLFDVIVYALIDPGLAHSYICTALVTHKNLHADSTKFYVQVTNPLGQRVTINLICRVH